MYKRRQPKPKGRCAYRNCRFIPFEQDAKYCFKHTPKEKKGFLAKLLGR